jgi:hypothetical protein
VTGTGHQAADTAGDLQRRAGETAEEFRIRTEGAAADAKRTVYGTADEAQRQAGGTWQYIKDTVSGAGHRAADTAEELQRRAGEDAADYQRRMKDAGYEWIESADRAQRHTKVSADVPVDAAGHIQVLFSLSGFHAWVLVLLSLLVFALIDKPISLC